VSEAPVVNRLSVDLSGKTALVTGAGRGIGRACALALARCGARVIAVARTESDLASLAAEAPGETITPLVADVTSEAFPERIEALRSLDILVNNAGTNTPLPIAEVPRAILDRMLAMNVRAVYLIAQAAVRVMLREGSGGSIINMSSQMGHVGSPNRTAYCMTKHAVEGLTKAMAVELAPAGIRVNSVAPTFIETPLTKPMLADPAFQDFVLKRIALGKLGQVEDVADAVVFLASPAASMITGDSLKVDGGWTAQ
jgi:NAD(P)-dependent dehydrogenase (short-subunit alcohol dehydrogenase family)